MKKILTVISGLLLLIVSCEKPEDELDPFTEPDPDPVVIKTDTLGTGWSQQKIDADFADIYFQDSLVGYVGGTALYKTNDGGTNWIKIPDASGAQNFFITPDSALHAISVTGTTYKKYTNGGQISTTSSLTAHGRGFDLFFTSNNVGFLTTDRGLLKTIDGGNKWEYLANAAGLQIQGYSGLSFIDSAKGWVFAPNRIFRSNGTVNNWSVSNLPATQSGGFSGIHVVSEHIIYVATFYGKVLKSTDGGQNFVEMTSLVNPQDYKFTDIHFLDELHGYASHGNQIYETRDGAVTWIVVVNMSQSPFIELHFTDRNHGWACTSDGKVLGFRR